MHSSTSSSDPGTTGSDAGGAVRSLGFAMAIVLVFAGLLQTAALPKPILTGSDRSMGQYESLKLHVARDGGYDVLFLGNSFTRQGVDVEIFDKDIKQRTGRIVESFNFGAGGTPLSVLPHVTRLAFRADTPTTSVFVLVPQMFSFRSDTGSAAAASPYGEAFADPIALRGALSLWLLDRVSLFAQRFGIKSALVFDHDAQRIEAKHQDRRGFQPNTRTAPPPPRDELSNRARVRRLARISPRAYAKLVESIGIAKAAGSQVWLVEGVANPDHFSLIDKPAERLRDIERLLMQAGKEMGANVVLQSKDFTLGPTDFADANHLKPAGAERFSHWLAERIDP